ncbi:phage tail assembly chaperone, partial [Streptococcus pyogenes]
YNMKMEDAAADLNRQLASELVNGWSLDDEFTKENLKTLLTQYKRLAEHVVVFHHEQLRQLQEK